MSTIKPILFNTDMVRALLGNHKTVTRRVVKGYVLEHLELDTDGSIIGVYDQDEGRVFPITDYAPYRPSDILYVRETFHQTPNGQYWYKADNLCTGCTEDGFCEPKGVKFHETCKICEYYDGYKNIKWSPSIHMPREAARIFLRVTSVKVERLQDIDDEGAKAESANWRNGKNVGLEEKMRRSAVERFAEIWDSAINPKDRTIYGWEANPWVWVIEFERCRN